MVYISGLVKSVALPGSHSLSPIEASRNPSQEVAKAEVQRTRRKGTRGFGEGEKGEFISFCCWKIFISSGCKPGRNVLTGFYFSFFHVKGNVGSLKLFNYNFKWKVPLSEPQSGCF